MQGVHDLPYSHRIAHDKLWSADPHKDLAKFVLQKVERCASLSCSSCNTEPGFYCNV